MSLTARDRLLGYLRQTGLSTARAEANLDAFAHELAEVIRTGGCGCACAEVNADRIDPGAGLVRPGEETT